MSFRGTSMIFDGIACEEMGLVLYDFDSHKQEATKFSSNLSISEDRIDGRYRSLFYGGTVNEPLTFTMILCAREDRARRDEPFDRWDLQKIASWLTGHTEYKWLSIVQDDLEDVRFRCVCSALETIEVAGSVWGFSCKVTCDSPYAYLLPRTYSYEFNATYHRAFLFSEASCNELYYPKMVITSLAAGDKELTITNSHEQSKFKIIGLPKDRVLRIDCENGVVSSNKANENPYAYIDFQSGFHFPRFARGRNTIEITGTAATYSFECEWPVNVGG